MKKKIIIGVGICILLVALNIGAFFITNSTRGINNNFATNTRTSKSTSKQNNGIENSYNKYEDETVPLVFKDYLYDDRVELKEGEVYDLKTKTKSVETVGEYEIDGVVYNEAKANGTNIVVVKQEGKWGYKIFDDKEQKYKNLTENIYDYAYNFSGDYAAVKKNGKWGYIDKTGKEVVSCVLAGAAPISNGLALVKVGSMYYWYTAEIIDKDKRELLDTNYLNNKHKDDRDSNVFWLMEPELEYDNIISYDDFYITQKNNKYGIITGDFIELAKPRYEEYGLVTDDLWEERYYADGWHVVDGGYRVVLGEDNPMHDEYIMADKKNLYLGLVEGDYETNEVAYYYSSITNKIYEYATYPDCIQGEAEYFYRDITLVQEAPIGNEYGEELEFKDGYLDTGGKYGYAKTPQELITEIKYDDARPFCNGYAAVSIGGKWGFINSEGKEIVPIKYDVVMDFDDMNRAIVKKNGKWGFVAGYTITGSKEEDEETIKYDEVYDFNYSGRAAVRQGNKWGFIDSLNSSEVIPPQYDKVRSFDNNIGFASVCKNGKWGCIDIYGDEIVKCEYDDIVIIGAKGNKAFIKKNGKWGLAQIGENEIIIPFMKSKYTFSEDAIESAKKDDEDDGIEDEAVIFKAKALIGDMEYPQNVEVLVKSIFSATKVVRNANFQGTSFNIAPSLAGFFDLDNTSVIVKIGNKSYGLKCNPIYKLEIKDKKLIIQTSYRSSNDTYIFTFENGNIKVIQNTYGCSTSIEGGIVEYGIEYDKERIVIQRCFGDAECVADMGRNMFESDILIFPEFKFDIGKIESGAFKMCKGTQIYIPDTVDEIEEGAFPIENDLTICAPTGSYAIEYAKEHGYNYIETSE